MSPNSPVRNLYRSFRTLFSQAAPLLDPYEAYELWSQNYDEIDGNALLFAESRAVRPLVLTSDLLGKDVLDAACGTGRYVQQMQKWSPRHITAADLSPGMIERVAAKVDGYVPVSLCVAQLEALPFKDESFDFVLCTLALGHVQNLGQAIGHLARVLRTGGRMVLSCYHPFGQLLGWQRTFKHKTNGKWYAVKYHTHSHAQYFSSLSSNSMAITLMEEPVIDESLKPFYEKARRLDLYERYRNFPLLLVVEARKQ